MAARTVGMFQDQNINAHVDGTVSSKADFTGQRKTRAGGRKPLGDLSNAGKPINQAGGKKALGSYPSGKPSVSLTSKEIQSKNSTIIMNDEVVFAKAKNIESNRRTANKASEKSHTGTRKALSDISNSRKPHVPLPSIKNKNSLKPSSLTEEPLHPSAIAEEQFLHSHRECIKSQSEAVDVHHFFKTVGLENDSDDPMTISFELPAISEMKSESVRLELEEVPEQLPEVQFAQNGSPAHCRTPKSSSYCTMWSDFAVNFKLIETPKLAKI